jgi:phosphoglycerate kinase
VYSLAPVAARLSELLGRPVELAADTTGPHARVAVAALRPGGVVMLENLRFNAPETSKDDVQRGRFADQLAGLADLYVSDGFGAVHRKHASVYDVALRLPHAAGYLVRAEVAALSRLTADIRRPYVVVLGGAKVADKFDAFGSLIAVADRILVGGAMAFPFLAAQGDKVGTSLFEASQVDAAASYLERASLGQIELPSDVVVAAEPGGPGEVVAADAIPADQMGLDIGPQTAARFTAVLAEARTVFWNGPMGMFERAQYAGGTRAVAGPRPTARRSPWSAVVTPARPFARSAWPRTHSATSPPAAAPAWNSSRVRRCPGWPCWSSHEPGPRCGGRCTRPN